MPVQKEIDGISVTIDGDEARLLRALKKSEKATEASSKKIDRSAKSISKSFDNTGKNVLRAAKFVAAGVALLAIPLSLHFKNAARDAEEMESKFDAVFKSSSDDVRKWSIELAQSVNRSQFALRDFSSTLQDTFVPLGFARGEAAELSKQLVELAVDVSSFSNKLESDVIRDFQSALVGNAETVRKYGIVITEASLTQEILNSGLANSKKEITELNKVQARLNIIMKGTTDAHGDAARTAESQANKEKELAAVSEELAIVLGQKLQPVTKEITQDLIDFVNAARQSIEPTAQEKLLSKLKEIDDELIILEAAFISSQLALSDESLVAKSLAFFRGTDLLIDNQIKKIDELKAKRKELLSAGLLSEDPDQFKKTALLIEDTRNQQQSSFIKRSQERLKIVQVEEAERAKFTNKLRKAINIVDVEREEERAEFIKKIRRDLSVFEIEQQEKAAKEAQKIMEENMRIAAEHAMDFSNVFANSFDDLLFQGAKLGDVLKGLLSDLLRLIVFKSILGPLAGSIGGSVSKAFGFADGGVMTSGGPMPLKSYAGGGIASSPQLAVFGEGATDEAFVPVPSGKIPVEMKGGGGRTVNIVQNLTFEAPVKDTIAATIEALAPVIQRQTQVTISNALSGIRTA